MRTQNILCVVAALLTRQITAVAGFFPITSISPSASVVEAFLYRYQLSVPDANVSTVGCSLRVPKLSYSLTTTGAVDVVTKKATCTFLDARQRPLTLATVSLTGVNSSLVSQQPVWFGSPVRSTYKCSGWGIKPFRGEDDLYDLGLTKPAREESTFCKVTDALRIKRSDETWGFLNGIYQSNDKSLMAKTQARFLDCFRLCGSTASIAYYRNKRCNKFMLMLPSLLSDTGKVNLYSGELNPAANKTITDMSWSLQQACSRGACIYQLASSLLLQLGFSSSVESKEGISTLLFDSTVNEVPIFRDLAGFVAMNQEGTVNIYVDNDIQKITPGTAFAQMMEAIFLYNRRVSSVAVTMQQSSIPGVSRCAQFNTMLENFLPVASIRACGTGREILPSWTCTEESISANYTPARVPTATYYGGAHTYILASYNAVTVTSGTEAGTLINSGGPRAEYRFPVALDADSLRIRIPYSSLQLVNSNQTLSTSLITAAAQAPVLSITRTPLLRRLASTFSGFNKITGNVATSSNAMTVTFPLLGRGFIGETNVTAAVFFQISYGNASTTILQANTEVNITLNCGVSPKMSAAGVAANLDSTKYLFDKMRTASAPALENVTFDVTTLNVQGLSARAPVSKIATIQSLLNNSIFTVLQDLQSNAQLSPVNSSSTSFYQIGRHHLAVPSAVLRALGAVVTPIETIPFNWQDLVKSVYQTAAIRSKFRWFADESSSSVTMTDFSKITQPAIWIVASSSGLAAVVSVQWTKSFGYINDVHPIEFMLLIAIVEYLRLAYGCPVIVAGDFEQEFRSMPSGTVYSPPGSSFASSWLTNLFTIGSAPESSFDLAEVFWPMNNTYNPSVLRKLTTTFPSMGRWFDSIWAPFAPFGHAVKPEPVNQISVNMTMGAQLSDSFKGQLGNCSVTRTTSRSGDYSNHIPVIYKVTLGTSTFSLVSYNLGFFDVPGASRLDFPRPSGKDIVDSEVLNGNVFVEPKLWTNQTNRLRDYLQNFDILLTQEEIPTIRARSEKPFIQGFEYTNMDGNFKGVYAKKNFANIQPGGVSTCSTLFYTWTGAGNLADATVDTDPDAVEEADMAAWNGQKRFNAKPSLLVCGFWGLSTPGVVSANDQPFIVVNVQDRAQYAPLSTTATYKFSPDSQAKLRETLYGICVQMKAQSGRSTLNCGLAETLEQKVPIIFLGDWNNPASFSDVPVPDAMTWKEDMANTFRSNVATVATAIQSRLGLSCPISSIHIPGDNMARGPNNLQCDGNRTPLLPFATTLQGQFRDFLYFCGPSAPTILDSKIDADLGVWNRTDCPLDLGDLDDLQKLNCMSKDIFADTESLSSHRAVRIRYSD